MCIRDRLEDVRGRIEADVRDAFLDLKTAANQLDVARNNQKVARETLTLTRQRFEAGITDAVEVTQAQESVAVSYTHLDVYKRQVFSIPGKLVFTCDT